MRRADTVSYTHLHFGHLSLHVGNELELIARTVKVVLGIMPVSYTHLDVYKRQLIPRAVKLSVAANKLTDPLPHSLFFYILQKFKQLRIERIVKPEHI